MKEVTYSFFEEGCRLRKSGRGHSEEIKSILKSGDKSKMTGYALRQGRLDILKEWHEKEKRPFQDWKDIINAIYDKKHPECLMFVLKNLLPSIPEILLRDALDAAEESNNIDVLHFLKK